MTKKRLHDIIFEAETPAGKLFDVVLFVAIVLSVVAVILESVPSIQEAYRWELVTAEWIFTGLFTIEYVVRIYAVERPKNYVLGFYGIIDLLSMLPSYLSLLIAGTQSLMVIRVLRLLRIFRVLKLGQFIGESQHITRALVASRRKILVFLFAVVLINILSGTLMFLVEGPEHGFVSIPVSIYWSIVTLTTVGYGDISPATPLGQLIASVLMIAGYGIIAVPTGIVTAEMAGQKPKITSTRACHNCGWEDHEDDARFCKRCGTPL